MKPVDKYLGQRFMVSPCGMHADWFYGHETAAALGWTDCTDLDAEQLQRFVAARQAGLTQQPTSAPGA